MNQRDATVLLIDFVREQAPERKDVLQALKVLEKRAEVLRLRHERRAQNRYQTSETAVRERAGIGEARREADLQAIGSQQSEVSNSSDA